MNRKRSKHPGRSLMNAFMLRQPTMLKSWAAVALDALLIGIILVVFAYFDHVRPKPMQTVTYERHTALKADTGASASAPATKVEEAAAVSDKIRDPLSDGMVEFDFEGVFTDGEIIRTENSYRSANISVTLTNYTSDGRKKQSYYVEEIYVRSMDYMRCLFAQDQYGDNIIEKFMSMVERSGSVCAINTDYYGYANRPYGIVVRNGVLYRDTPSKGKDTCILYKDGMMQSYPYGTQLDGEQLIDDGAWQVFCFGPILVQNGELLKEYEDPGRSPRTAFGMIEPGHYLFVVMDGRREDYAEGYNYKDTAKIMQRLGCVEAFNLDGGATSQMSFENELANDPFDNGRRTSDILFVAELGTEQPYEQ